MRRAPSATDDDPVVPDETRPDIEELPPRLEPDAVPAEPNRRSRLAVAARVAVAMAALVLIGVALHDLPSSGRGTSTIGQPSPVGSPLPPPPPPFEFESLHVYGVPVVPGKNAGAPAAGRAVANTLGTFYHGAFLDPPAWKDGVSDETWGLFVPAVRERAMDGAGSLTLGSTASKVETLEPTRSSLTVRVLLDPVGKAVSAVASVVFDAEGTTHDGQLLTVTSRASFLLRPFGNQWLIVGYPSAKTTADSEPPPPPSPSPTPETTPSPSGSASP